MKAFATVVEATGLSSPKVIKEEEPPEPVPYRTSTLERKEKNDRNLALYCNYMLYIEIAKS